MLSYTCLFRECKKEILVEWLKTVIDAVCAIILL